MFEVLSKAYLRNFPLGGNFNLEEVAFTEFEHPRNDVRGEHLNLVVEEQDLVIVALPGKSDFVLSAGQLFLNRKKILSGLQVGVILDDQHEFAERFAESAFGFRSLGDGIRSHCLASSLCNSFKSPALVLHIALGSLDKVGNQIVPAL